MVKAVALVLVATGAMGCASLPPAPAADALQTIPSSVALSTFDTVWTVVRNTYVDTAFVASRWMAVRDSLRPRASLITNRQDLSDLLATTLKRIPDSHFYIIPEAAANANDVADSVGAGGTTGLSIRAVGDRGVAWRVEPGSPAEKGGITAGQTVAKIGERDVSSALRQVQALPAPARPRALSEVLYSLNHALSPSVGATVHARVGLPSGKLVDHALVAVPVTGTVSQFGNLPPIAGNVVVRRLSSFGAASDLPCVGLIAFNIWLPALVPELEKGMDHVSDCTGVVIDLRGNPGGVGAMVMGFGGYFVDSVISLGTMRSRQLALRFAMNPRRVKTDGSPAGPFHGPLAILVDAMTASTSEIFATGMQRIGRARVFGERSAGEALPAMMDRLPSGDVFVHAVADFTDPDGKRIEGAGVMPDEITPLSGKDLAEGRDAALEAAMRWIRSNPVTRPIRAPAPGSVPPNFN